MNTLEIIEFMAGNDVTITEADVSMIAHYRRSAKEICRYFMTRKNLYNRRNRHKYVIKLESLDTWE